MSVKVPRIPFIRRRRSGIQFAPPPVTTLQLIAATYDPDVSVRLVFNNPIDIAYMQAKNIKVNDGEFEGKVYQGKGLGDLVNPTTVDIELDQTSGDLATGVHLSADPASGIKTIDGEESWAGVGFLTLPFP